MARAPLVSWQETPLREGLQRLASHHRLAIWLDRRINPDMRVTQSVGDRPFVDLVKALVQSADADVALVEPVIYVGPPGDRQDDRHGCGDAIGTSASSA